MFVLIINYNANLISDTGFLVIKKAQKVVIEVQFDWYCFGVTPNFILKA